MKYWKYIFIAAFVLVVGAFNYNIYQKEATIREGDLVFLELAPVDPRSLMQGDFMQLRYALASTTWDSTQIFEKYPNRGYLIIAINDKRIGVKQRYASEIKDLKSNEYAVKYFKKDTWRTELRIGAESYFFQEGKGYALDSAKYGALRIDKKGNSLLVGLYDKNLQLIDLEKAKVRKDTIL